MKKLILSVVFVVMGFTLFAQQYGDTIHGKQPNYYYNFWYDDWRHSILPTDTVYLEWGQIVDSFYIADGGEHIAFHYGWITRKSVHQAFYKQGAAASCRLGDGGEITSIFYSPKPLKIVGLATNTKTCPNIETLTGEWYEPHDMPDSNEYFVLYDEINGVMVRKKALPWHIPENSRYMKLDLYYNTDYYYVDCENLKDTSRIIPWYEYYFDTAVYVCDSFFLGKTTYSYYNYLIHYFRTGIPSNAHTLTSIGYVKAGVSDPICPDFTLDYRCRKGVNINDNSQPWQDVAINYSILIYPIFEVACPESYGLRGRYISGGQYLLAWDTSRYQTSWEIAYAPEGTPVDDATIVGALSPQLQLNGLDSNQTYRVWLRSKCVYDTTYYSDWTDSILLSPGGPVAIDGLDALPDGVQLFPNPATNRVSVTSSSPIEEVTIFNLEGEQVLHHNGGKNPTVTLDLSFFSAGTYLAKIHTSQGSITRKLVVR